MLNEANLEKKHLYCFLSLLYLVFISSLLGDVIYIW